ncbi:aquaporin-6 isoform X1 [Pelodiscus sinensis]|uniref:aquaporin-6 isoform X1 n=1 Tax=Pelodiscus sinensis TaxID=13735 RepID=UPI003F6C26EE
MHFQVLDFLVLPSFTNLLAYLAFPPMPSNKKELQGQRSPVCPSHSWAHERMWKEVLSVTFYRAVFSEFLATSIYVFFGLGSVLPWPSALPTILQISITFNLAAATVVHIAWHVSGALLNPAVTLAFLLGSRISLARAACYMVAQLAGGIAGAATLYGVTPEEVHRSFGINTVRSNITSGQAVAVELILTFQLVLCYFASTDRHRNSNSPATFIGMSVALGHLIGIYFTGCSMNPARSFGPAVIVKRFSAHWIFWVGPMAGGMLAALIYNVVLSPDLKSLSQRLAILKGTLDMEAEDPEEAKQSAQPVSLTNVVQHRL